MNLREAAVGVGGTGVVQGAQNTWVNMGGVEGKIGSRGFWRRGNHLKYQHLLANRLWTLELVY